MKKILYSLLLNLIFTTLVFAQNESKINGQIIVKLTQLAQIQEVAQKLNSSNRENTNFSILKTIDEDFKYYLLKVENTTLNDDELLYALRSEKGIEEASFNYRASPRAVPNDTFFNKQWGMTKIQCEKVWDSTTGGKTACNDDIVVVVIEPGFGFSLKHEDILPNLFVNSGEIANDGKDNDGNGYIDDVHGINIATSKGDISPDPQAHGTSVCSIIGAKGNNKVGVTGVNWNVKMLLVSDASTEADVIAAYAYVIKMRKLYNESNGKKGAFIVVTNYSGGIDNVFEQNFPLWCGMYNQLGEMGILSAGAGPNSNTNVDVKGDIPTTCSSPFLIAVTNSDRTDVKVQNAGFGPINIDLAAPGGTSSGGGTQVTGSFSARADATNKAYKEFTGTSAATPFVAGAIALLYSLKDTSFCKAAKQSPKETALLIKDILLENVDKTTALGTQTSSGGRLNVAKAFEALKSSLKPTVVTNLALSPNPTNTTLNFRVSSINGKAQTYSIFNVAGQLVYQTEYTPKPFSQNKVSIDVRNLAKGFYTLSTRDDEGNLVSKKFLVQ